MFRGVDTRKAILGAFSFLTIVSSAHAAEPLQPAVTSGIDWRGFHVGFGGGFGAVVHDIELASPIGSGNLNGIGGEGLFGEVTAGYDFMASDRFLLGGFIDARYGNIGPTLNVSSAFLGGVAGGDTFDLHLTNSYGFDVGARLGYLTGPNTLAYLLGGYTWQRFDLDLTAGTESLRLHEDRGGYVVGVGLETAVSAHWTVKGEYRYAYFGNDGVLSLAGVDLNVAPSTHTAHIGANYRFNGRNGGGASFNAPAYEWTGVYIGGALGAGAVVHDIGFDVGGIASGGFNGLGGEGVLGEVNAGYDRDFGSVVGGLMVDANLSGIGSEIGTSIPGLGASADARYGFDVLARLGIKVNDATLAYVLGGYSWQRFEAGIGSGACDCGSIEWDSSGFSVGGGLETAVSESVTVGIEYRYAQFEADDFDTGGMLSVEPSFHTVRVGAKFKFN